MLKNIYILLKADISSLNIFKNSLNMKNSSKIKSVILALIILVAIMASIGSYAVIIADTLKGTGFEYASLVIILFSSIIITTLNSMTKSFGFLFGSKDNDILMSMPFTKREILLSRVIKILLSAYIWNFIFLIPNIFVYYTYANLSMYSIISFVLLYIFLPLIPTVLGSIIGYIVAGVSSKFKKRNLLQSVISTAAVIAIMYFSFNLESAMQNMAANIQEILSKLYNIYFPLKLYIESLVNENVWKLLAFVCINIVVLVSFVYILGIVYFKIISKLAEKHSSANYKLGKEKKKSIYRSLIIKEAKKYFGTSVYVTNTIIGPIILLIASIYLLISRVDLYSLITSSSDSPFTFTEYEFNSMLPIFLVIVQSFVLAMCNVSSSSISMEQKSLPMLKAMPIEFKNIAISKALFHILVIGIPTVISNVIFGIAFNFGLLNCILVIISSLIVISFHAISGVYINLLWPRLNGSDIEIVKQSAALLVSMLINGLFGIVMCFILYVLNGINDSVILLIIDVITIFLIAFCYYLISTKGKRKFEKL